MTTARSPLRVLKGQADHIAKLVKAIARGENPTEDRGGKLAAARNRGSVKFGVVMDDKVLTIDMTWATIRGTSEVGISEFILREMKEARDVVH
jgi:hypothetical protein